MEEKELKKEINKGINSAKRFIQDKKIRREPRKKREDLFKYTSLYIDEKKGIFAEQVFNDTPKFAIYNTETGEISYQEQITLLDDKIIMPFADEEVEKKAVLLPAKAEEYGTDEELDEELRQFIKKWLDIPEENIQFAIWNIKRSWVYERFHTLNYLRALGDTGMGKSRFLDTLGHLHYKPIATSGATTSAPIFRVLEKWKGTLIMDEADLSKTDETVDIIKIINLGYEDSKYIMRCDKENNNKINFFNPYGPKIIATRKTFQDKAVESRCITTVMEGTMRKDIPRNLNESFFQDSLRIRNKLLMWRFRNFYKINPDKKYEFDFGDIEPRVEQIVTSFISLFGDDEKQMEGFKDFIIKYQEDLIDERKNSFDGYIVGAIHSLIEKGQTDISASDIVEEANLTGSNDKPLNPRALTNHLKVLGFGKNVIKKVEGKTKRVLPLTSNILTRLFKRFGYSVTNVTVVMDTRENDDNIQKYDIGMEKSTSGEVEGGGIHNQRNLGNYVTSETEKFKNLSDDGYEVTEVTITDNEPKTIVEKTKEIKEKIVAKKKFSFGELMEEIGYDDFALVEEILTKMKEEGMIVENPRNKFEVL